MMNQNNQASEVGSIMDTGSPDTSRRRHTISKLVVYVSVVLLEFALTIVLHIANMSLPIPRFPAPFVLMQLAIAYLFGEGPAILAFILGFIAFEYLFIEPINKFWPITTSPQGWGAVAEFSVITAVACIIGIFMRRVNRRIHILAHNLSESSHKYNNMLESITDAFFTLERNWRLAYVNTEAEHLLGKPREQLIGKVIWDIVPDTIVTDLKQQLEKAISENTTSQFEEFYPPLDRWYRIRVYPSSDCLCVYTEDITEEKLAERILRKSEEKFRAVFDNAADSVYIHDTRGRILEVNQVAINQLGYSREEFLHMTTMDIDAPKNTQFLAERIEELHRQGFVIFETAHKCKNSTIIPVEINARMIEYEGQPAVISIARDLTKRKQVEEEAIKARSEAEYRAAELQSFFSSITEGTVLYDIDGHILRINNAMRKILGAPDDLPVQKFVDIYKLETIDGKPVPIENYTSSRAKRGESFNDIRWKVTTPWKETLISASGGPIRDARGQIIGAAVVWRDIGELIAAEKKQQELYDREHRIAETLQENLLTPVPNRIDGFAFETLYKAALGEAQVGGDFYDVFPIGTDRIGIVVGDVSGKGLSAAVQVAMAKYSIRSRAFEHDNPATILAQVNKALVADTSLEGFVTVFLGILDCGTKVLTYANAGHSPAIYWNSTDQNARLMATTGAAMGCDSSFTYADDTIQLNLGDELFIGTDGLYEVRCEGVFLDIDGLLQIYTDLKRSGTGLATALVDRVIDYCRADLRDDVAILRISVVE